jgi:hypothetical protein
MSTVPPQSQQITAAAPVAAPVQPVVVQQVPAPAPEVQHHEDRPQEIRIYSHSSFFYWWPVWATGYLMAALTIAQGVHVQIGGQQVLFYPGKNPGVIYSVVFLLVILLTNVTVRGLASVVTILSIMFLTVLFAWLGWWDEILRFLPNLAIYMNLGFYLFFSTLIFLVWVGSVFAYDRMSYWIIRPGQITHEFVIGGAEKSYDTRGMVFEKLRQDFFRQWILGFGSGDIRISTTGAKREDLYVPNVLFVDWKVQQIQRLIAMQPDEFASPRT